MTSVSRRFNTDKGRMSVVGVYVQEDDRKEETEQFYDELQKAVNRIHTNYYLIISGDFNARVGNKEFRVLYVPLEKARLMLLTTS
jgi:hypothetical protein